MAQEINVESLLKKADDAAKLADKYPKDGLKQIYAAEALTNIALNEKRDFDRAQTYTSRALDEYPGKEVIGRKVTVRIDPGEKGKYTVDIDALFEEIEKEKSENDQAGGMH
jgi:hypothetical protein